MRRMLVVAVAASLLGSARAGDPEKAAPGGEPATSAGKAAEAAKKDGGAKAQEEKAPAPAPKADGQPEKSKPCEPIRPCPID